MNKENINRLKKYLFLISIFFAFLIGVHIGYIYLYHNSIEKPIEGGSVSEGIIGEFPHLNPLKDSKDYNKNIIYLLYRGLLKYDFENNVVIGDLANCDLKDLSYIQCSLNPNKWSDGTNITVDDVVSTYNIIKNSDINPYISGLLRNTTLKVIKNNIVFESNIKDVNIINALYQPIVSKNVIDNIGNKELLGKFNPLDGIYSGPYKVENISYDDSLGIQKLFLIRNENFNPLFEKNKVYISKFVFKFFKDLNHFNKHKDTINIFHDTNYNLNDISPRINTYYFNPNQYISLFINEEKITNNDLRKFLLNAIDREKISKILGIGYSNIYNPYLLENIDTSTGSKAINIENIFKDLGYFKKSTLVENQINKVEKEFLDEIQKKQYKALETFSSGVKFNYTFSSNDVLNLKGNIGDKKIDEIYVNEDKLLIDKKTGGYSYFLSLENKNISLGTNNYKVYTKTGKEDKVLLEEFSVIYETNKDKLQKLQNDLVLANASSEELKQYNQKIQKLKDKLNSLDNNFYYNEKLEPYELRFNYIEGKTDVLAISNLVKNLIETYGIKVNSIPLSSQELAKKVQENKKDYDLILIGIDLGVTSNNIFPYFHSSQANSGFNLSNIKNSGLDDILEKLKSEVLTKKETIELKQKAIEILSKNNVVKTLYNKNQVIYYDKNISNLKLEGNISNMFAFYEKLKSANINFEKSINFENKGLFDFLNFVKKVFKNDSTLER